MAPQMPPLSQSENKSGIIFFTMSVTEQNVSFCVPYSVEVIEKTRADMKLATIEEYNIYDVSGLTIAGYVGDVSIPSAITRKQYVERNAFACESVTDYRDTIVPALLLGCRVRDYEQRCATVIDDLVLTMTMFPQNGRMEKGSRLELKMITGEKFSVEVVKKEKEGRRWKVTCKESIASLPPGVVEGSRLEIVSGVPKQAAVTHALFQFTKKGAGLVDNWPLLQCIYGKRITGTQPALPKVDSYIRLKMGGVVTLNAEQAEAITLYNCPTVPGFVIEAPPGSGKTLTAAAMAVSYKGEGVQLFLSTANVPVLNIALAVDKLNYGNRSPFHLVSAEYEDKMTEESRSPFSVLTQAMKQLKLTDKTERPEELERAKTSLLDKSHDIYFATVDTILRRLSKPNKGGGIQEDAVKQLLMTKVERVVIDEASQLTEAALNAIILCFPKAQIVLIGDSKQLEPFRYEKGKIVSELAARPALDVVQDKKNLPVINLRHVYRAEPSLIAHYNHLFYGSKLMSCKKETNATPLICFRSRGVFSPCVFWKVKNGKSDQDGFSKINTQEIAALEFILDQLANFSNIEMRDVMIISYYEAQRKAVQKRLPNGYEVLTVDSAQGREKKGHCAYDEIISACGF